MPRIVLLFLAAAVSTACLSAADTLHVSGADTVWVIPAGPVAGSFTKDARVSVADTVAGWARIQIEAWVPVSKVIDRISAQPAPLEPAGAAVGNPARKKAPARQCEATTRTGTRCTRNAQKGTRFCWQHQQR